MAAFVIGIGGGSASGKSSIAEALSKKLSPLQVTVMNQDRYFHGSARLPAHANRAGTRSWPDHNHPESFDFDSLRRDVRRARGSGDVVIVEGILVLHDAELRDLMDLKVFVAADADERIVRRIRRNLAAGAGLDGICDFYLDSVRYRHREFCEPTRAHADVVVPGGQDEREGTERALEEVCGRVRAALSGQTAR
jgi:uridine kinase